MSQSMMQNRVAPIAASASDAGRVSAHSVERGSFASGMYRAYKLKIPATTARIEEESETLNSRATPLGVLGSSLVQKRGQQNLAMSVEKK